MWVGRAEESDEHLLVNKVVHVVRARAVRRCEDNENGGLDVVKLTATPSHVNPDVVKLAAAWKAKRDGLRRRDAERVSRHTETVRCEARRHECRLEYGRNPLVYGRNPLVTARRAHHELERALGEAGTVSGEPNLVSDREKEPFVLSQSTADASAPTVTAQTSHTFVKRLRLEGKQHTDSHESPATLPKSSRPMDRSDAPARVRFNMNRSSLGSHSERPKQRRVLEDPDGDEVMTGEIELNEEVEHPWSERSLSKRS